MPTQQVFAGFISKEMPKTTTIETVNKTVAPEKTAFEKFTAKKVDFRNKILAKANSLKELLPAPLKTLRKGKYLSIGIALLVVGLVFELVDGIIWKGAGRALGYIGPIFMAVGLIFLVLWFLGS